MELRVSNRPEPRSRILRGGSALVAVVTFCATPARATDVTLWLVDQAGVPVAGTGFSVLTAAVNASPGVPVDLPAGLHTVRIFPGILGFSQGGTLFRDETVTVGSSAVTFELEWVHADFVATVRNQSFVPIAGSLIDFTVIAGGVVSNGTPLYLPVTEHASTAPIQGTLSTGYVARTVPGILGIASPLRREHPPAELTASGVVLDAVWPQATLLVRVVDSFGVEIPASHFELRTPTAGLPGGVFPAGSAVLLPVTEDSAPPAIQGALADGYSVRATPGILGAAANELFRDYGPSEVTIAGSERDLPWPLATLMPDVLDQSGVSIPSSLVDLRVQNGVFSAGTTVVLPVTEDPLGPPIQGAAAAGYMLRTFPGINGIQQGGQLFRDHGRQELAELGDVRAPIWEVANGSVHVVDAAEDAVPGASVFLPTFLGEVPSDTTVALPIDDNALYPTLQGAFAGGYPFSIRLDPAASLSGPFSFEILNGNVVNPPFVQIGGNSYGLRFDLQPVVDVDGDGFPLPDDCDDSDPSVFPGAPDLPGDSLDQDCDGMLACDPGGAWRNHGQFVSCVAQEANDLLQAGLIGEDQKDEIVSAAAQSDVGKH